MLLLSTIIKIFKTQNYNHKIASNTAVYGRNSFTAFRLYSVMRNVCILCHLPLGFPNWMYICCAVLLFFPWFFLSQLCILLKCHSSFPALISEDSCTAALMLLWMCFASFWMGFLFLPAKQGKTAKATSPHSVFQYEYIEAIVYPKLQIPNHLCIITILSATKKKTNHWNKFFFQFFLIF